MCIPEEKQNLQGCYTTLSLQRGMKKARYKIVILNRNTSQNMKLVLTVVHEVGNDGIHKTIILKKLKN